MDHFDKLLEKKTIFTAAEARQITNLKTQKEKQMAEVLHRCHTYIREAAAKGEEYTHIEKIPHLVHKDLVVALEALGYEVAVDSYGDESPVSLGVTW